jgi:phosphoribosylformimino-5-aminoimidazole carboxamide ribotide isomerase
MVIMRLIPVIDLKDGVVVHARRGQRDAYLPLSPTADVFAVIDQFLQLYEFYIIYLADLNAIMQQGNNSVLIETVLRHYPNIEFWLDSGFPVSLDLPNYLPVLGSECCDIATLARFGRFVLSLDFSAQNQPLGDQRLFTDNGLWSKQVIIMTLARVGSGLGVDMEKLLFYLTQFPETEFVAAGGVRHMEDLQQLKNLGVQYVLLASALHAGTIGKAEIDRLAVK